MSLLSKNRLKILFSDVIRGYTEINSEKFGKFLVKHFNSFDSAAIDALHADYVFKAKATGVQDEIEKEKFIIEQGQWTPEQDREIFQLESYVKNLVITRSKLFKKADLNEIDAQIKQNNEKLDDLRLEKRGLIGWTAETFAAKKINEYYIESVTFKDKNLSLPLFDSESFGDLEDSELSSLIKLYNETMVEFKDENLKKIALSSFFTNFFYLCDDNPLTFYGKPVISLTFYQVELFGYGRYFKSILSSDSKPPQEICEDPDKLVEWFSSGKIAKQLMEQNPNSDAVSLVGATKEDYAKLGVETSDVNSLVELAKSKGGKLDMNDILKIHGQ